MSIHRFRPPAFIGLTGLNSTIRNIFYRSGAQVDFNQRIVELSKSGNKWKAVSENGLEVEQN